MRYVQPGAAIGVIGVALTFGVAPAAGAHTQEPPRPRPDGLHLPLPESSYRPLIPELPQWSRQPQPG